MKPIQPTKSISDIIPTPYKCASNCVFLVGEVICKFVFGHETFPSYVTLRKTEKKILERSIALGKHVYIVRVRKSDRKIGTYNIYTEIRFT